MIDITVYTTTPCPYCTRVKRLLDSKGLDYTEINLAKDPEGRSELVGKTGMMTFPQVLIGERVIGGFTETSAAVKNGELDRMLAAAAG